VAEKESLAARAGRNVPVATAIGAGLLALVVVTLSFDDRFFFAVLVALVMIPAVIEFSRASASGGAKVDPIILSITSAAIVLAAWNEGFEGLAVVTAVSTPVLLISRLRKGSDHFLANATASLFALLYLPIPAAFAVMLAHPADGRARVMIFIVAVSLSDTGGYIVGVLFGKHPLAPHISPKKSWEGVFGSVLFSTVGTSILFGIWFHKAWWHGVILAVVAILAGTAGDLVESAIKRDIGVKDMGKSLPGHGGFLDRLDSLLIAAPFAFLIIRWLA
jgi:phosphatidate cytidylyltransferase